MQVSYQRVLFIIRVERNTITRSNNFSFISVFIGKTKMHHLLIYFVLYVRKTITVYKKSQVLKRIFIQL